MSALISRPFFLIDIAFSVVKAHCERLTSKHLEQVFGLKRKIPFKKNILCILLSKETLFSFGFFHRSDEKKLGFSFM